MKFRLTSAVLAPICIAIVTFATQLPEVAIAQQTAPDVTTRSSPREIALAKHLRKIGAKLYTAYWCPHCHRQKQRFGLEAVRRLEVIECDRGGVKPQPEMCRSKGIRFYPSWEINGKIYSGSQTLENLANFSQYRDR